MAPKDAAKHLIGKKCIAIVTGAGISAASGIPTFRGDNGFWSRSYGGVTDPMVIMTQKFFYKNPELVWEWHFDFIELLEKCKPNKSHYELLKFQEYCLKQTKGEVQCHLITQNIDDFDAQIIKASKTMTPSPIVKQEGSLDFAITPHIIEMHGNVRYMHCSDENKECAKPFFKSPGLEEVSDRKNHVPKCATCGAPMKPHAMFFDEAYSEHYYKAQTTRDMELDIDLLIVIGTALATGGAKGMVLRALDAQKIPVIEINMDPIVNEGYTINVAGKSEVVLEQMFSKFYDLVGVPRPKPTSAVLPKRKAT